MYKLFLSIVFLFAVNYALNTRDCTGQWINAGDTYGGAVQCMAKNGKNLNAGNHVSVFFSATSGTNWMAVNSPLTAVNVRSLIVFGAEFSDGTESGGALSSSYTGADRNGDGSNLKSVVSSLAASGKNMAARTGGGCIILSDTGVSNWTLINNGLMNTSIRAFAVSGTNLRDGSTLGVYLFTGSGINRIEAGSGLINNYIISLAVSGLNRIAESRNRWIPGQSLSGLIIPACFSSGEISDGFQISQNCTGMFNSLAEVKFQMLNSGNAEINVFDFSGLEVATLVNEKLQSGFYEVSFDGSGLNSGVYFYRITTDDFSDIRKMLFLN